MSARYTGGLVYNAPGGWSGFFPSNSSLTFGYTSGIALGSTYTIECFINPVSVSQGYLFEMAQSNTGGFSYLVFYISSGQVGSATRPSTSGTEYYSSAGTVVAGVWQHVALVNTAGTAQLYVNGFAVGATYSMPALSTTPVFCAIGQRANGFSPSGTYYNGYISNLRITTSAVYTSNFTPPSGALLPLANTKLLTCRYPTFVDGSTNAYALTATSTTVNTANPFPTSQLPNPALGGAGNGVYTMSQYAALKAANLWPAFDPFYKNVTLNLHGNAGAVLPFNTDASTNNFQVAQVGDARASSYTPFIANGYWSNYFDGTDDFLSYASTTTLNFGTADFTVECWINLGNTTSSKVLVGGTASNAFGFRYGTQYLSNNGLSIYRAGVADLENCSFSFVANTWYHVAVVRQSNVIKFFVNGTQQTTAGSGGASYSFPTETNVRIGTSDIGVEDYIGNISNLRVTKSAVYTSNFTPSTTPLTAITNTSLLTCQSNRFIDNSTNAFTITQNGNVAVNPFQPFTAPTGTSAYGSGYFDGSGDYLTVASNVAFGYGTGDFTYECWFYLNAIPSASTGAYLLDQRTTGTQTVPAVYVFSDATIVFYVNGGTVASGGSVVTNTWYSFAISRVSGTTRMFLNGTQIGSSYADSNNYITSPVYIGSRFNAQDYLNGYISNARILKGTGYSTYTVPTTPLTAITNTSLLTLQTNAPSQNNTFLDSSTNNFVITRNGNTTQGTFSPYGTTGYWSNYTAGSSGAASRVDVAGTSGIFGTNISYTIEGWFNYSSNISGDNQNIIATNNNVFPTRWLFDAGVTGGTIQLRIVTESNGTVFNGTAVSYTLGTWVHLAVVNDNVANTCTFYVNGVAAGTRAKLSLTAYSTLNLLCNSSAAGAVPFYVSSFRIVNNVAVYTSNFTPSTTPLTAISGTAVLTFQNNRFIDNSGSNLAMTPYGTNQIQKYTPFAPPSYYQPSVIGGSGYFDGSGDYLSFASNDAFRVDQGDWTIEGWVYITSTASNFTLANRGVFVSVYSFYCGSSGTALYYEAGTGGWAATGYTSSANAVVAGQWNHIAYVRSGTSLFMYSNGVRVFSQTVGSVGANVNAPMWVGQYLGGSAGLNGNMTDFRFVKGTAVYTGSTYTIPTAPLTAIANTSALINYTNAGILDNAMMNDLETVGNAQISTSVKKYGSASMYFDGSGDWLFTPTTPNMVIPASSSFTMECWAYLTGAQNTFRMLVSEANGNSSRYLSINSAGIEAQFGGSSGTSVAANYTFTLNTWYHIALVRNGTTVAIYINGQAQSVSNPTQTNAFFDVGTGMFIGRWGGSPSYEWPGYIDDLRITKGVARYITNFTPPTSQVQDQ